MRKSLFLCAMAILLWFAVTIPALAGGMNYGYSWETLGGARVNG
jgi:hypothetical protein